MYVRKFKYIDFDGNEREEEAYFHLTKAEVTMWLTTNGEYTLDELIIELAKNGDTKRVMEIFEDLILRSYGKKSLDGRRFIKSPELREEFRQTEMYSELFMDMLDADKAVEFVKKILPNDLAREAEKIAMDNQAQIQPEQSPVIPYA